MILFFIRHAQSENNALLNATQSRSGRLDDPALTSIGKKQASLLAEFLEKGNPAGGYGMLDAGENGFGITHLYTSLMLRAVETALRVGNCLNLRPVGSELLHESGGVYRGDETKGDVIPTLGKSASFFRQNFPELQLPPELLREGWWGGRPFEILEQRRHRAEKLLACMLEKHGGTSDRVAMISHADFFNEFLAVVTGAPKRDGLWYTSHNTGITRIDFKGIDRRVVYMNRTSHLPPDMLTA